MKFKFEVDEQDFTVKIWAATDISDYSDAPSILQPFPPTDAAKGWDSVEEATAWAEAWIEEQKTAALETAPAEETPAE